MGRKIQEILKEWKRESGATRVIQFKWEYLNESLIIYSSQCGILIGRGGIYYDKYLDILKKELSNLKAIEFKETDYYWV